MRTGVEPYTIALCLKDGCKCMGDRAFAIRAPHMNCPVAAMWMAEVFIKEKCASKPLFIRRCPNILEHRGRVEQVFYSFLVGHSNIFLNLLKKLFFAVAPGFMFSLVRSFSNVSFSSRDKFSGI